MTLPDRLGPAVRAVIEFLQEQWFDRTRNVQTSGDVSLHDAGVDAYSFRDSEAYQPAPSEHIRLALRQIGIADVSAYTYVDLGSGKGRSLFIAAERPFRQVIGVELSPRLHARASSNISTFRHGASGCRDIQSLNLDATQFHFPSDPLVLYMFNPFGTSTVRQVLANLQTSLERHPRHIVVVLLWPQWEAEVAAMSGMQLLYQAEECQIFEAHRPHRSLSTRR